MTPGELQLMRAMLREEIQPVRDDVASLTARTKALEENDVAIKRKVSGQHRAVTAVLLPQLESGIKADRLNDVSAIADAFEKLTHVVNDSADRSARTEEAVAKILENSNSAQVALPDGKGGTSIRPASLVAAESSVRTENKQEGMAALALTTSLDSMQAKKDSAAAKRWQKRVTTPLLIATPVLVQLVHELWPLIFPHAAP